MRYNVTLIKWDADGENEATQEMIRQLPTETTVEAEDTDEIADILSDEYGFCVKSLQIKPA